MNISTNTCKIFSVVCCGYLSGGYFYNIYKRRTSTQPNFISLDSHLVTPALVNMYNDTFQTINIYIEETQLVHDNCIVFRNFGGLMIILGILHLSDSNASTSSKLIIGITGILGYFLNSYGAKLSQHRLKLFQDTQFSQYKLYMSNFQDDDTDFDL